MNTCRAPAPVLLGGMDNQNDTNDKPYLTGAASSMAQAHLHVLRGLYTAENTMAFLPVFQILVGVAQNEIDPAEIDMPNHADINRHEWELIRNAVAVAFAASIKADQSIKDDSKAHLIAEKLMTAVKEAPRIYRMPLDVEPGKCFFLSRFELDEDSDEFDWAHLCDPETGEWRIFDSANDAHKWAFEHDVEQYRITKAIAACEVETVFNNTEKEGAK